MLGNSRMSPDTFLGNVQGQNYFPNNVKALFAFFTFILSWG